MASNSRAVGFSLAALCAVAAMGAAWVTADVQALRPDTASYLFFDPSRSIGYPLFLWIADKIGGSALFAVPLQMAVLAGSLCLLGYAFFRWTGSPMLAVLFQLALVLSPEMWKFAPMLITEATATAAVALWCAQLLRTIRAPAVPAFALLSVLSGVAMLLKPSLAPLFLGTAVLVAVLPRWRERGKALALVGAGLLLSWAATPVANWLVHGSADGGSPVARGVLQHTLFCPIPERPADADAAFVDDQARSAIAHIGAAPAALQPGLKRLYTGELRFGLIIPTLGRRHGLHESWRTDPILWRIASQRILANPTCYGRSVLHSYASMASYKSYSTADSRRLEEFVTAAPGLRVSIEPLLPGDAQKAEQAARAVGASEQIRPGQHNLEPPSGRPLLLIWIARTLYTSAAAIGLAALFLLCVRNRFDPALSGLIPGLAALGVVFHGVFGLTAIVELPLMRYTVPLWPVVCTTLGLAGARALRLANDKFVTRRGARRREDEMRYR